MKMSTVRKITVGAVFASVALSLATHAATGTLSAIGYDSIALLCPVGALEVLLGAREFLLHPLILLAVVVVLALVFGKVFCAWLCPTPLIKALFRKPQGKGAAEGRTRGEARAKSRAAQGHPDGGAAQLASDGDGDGGAQAENTGDGTQLASDGDGVQPASVVAAEVSARAESAAANKAQLALSESEKELLGASGSCAHECAACAALAPVGGARDGFKLDTRFAVLGGTLASAAIFGFPVFCLICPVGLTFATFIGLWHLFQFNETTWGLIVFPVLLILELVVLRKWCHKLCPISALLSLISTGNRLFKPRVDEKKCLRSRGIDCHACVESCPELLDPHAPRIPECSKCGRCKEACPAGAISFAVLGSAKKQGSARKLEPASNQESAKK